MELKKLKQDFFTPDGDGILIMTFNEVAERILRMKCGESMELYINVNKNTKECLLPLSIKKEQWNGTPFYLLGGHGLEVRTINYVGRSKDEYETTCFDALDSYGAKEIVGVVVSKSLELTPEELFGTISEEKKKGCKYLLVFRNEEEMEETFEGNLYAISDTDGKFLCYLCYDDYVRMEDEGDIVDSTSIADMHFYSDWAIANSGVRERVFSRRIAVVFTTRAERVSAEKI